MVSGEQERQDTSVGPEQHQAPQEDSKAERERRERERATHQAQAVMESLREANEAHEESILKLQEDRSKVKDRIGKEIRKWERYAISTLEALAQRALAMHLIAISASLDVEFEYCHALMNVMNQLQLWIRKKGDRMENMDVEGMYATIATTGRSADFLVDFPDRQHKISESRRLRAESEALMNDYKATSKKLLVRDTFSTRKANLYKAIEMGDETAEWDPVYHRYWREDSPECRDLFRSLMLDERQSEGQLIRRWRALLHSAGPQATISADAVRAFFVHILRQIAERYGILRDRKMCILELLVARLVYPLIAGVVCEMRSKEERSLDASFERKAAMLRSLTPEDLGVFNHHLPREHKARAGGAALAYGAAVAELQAMGQCLVPVDMLQHALETVRHINAEGSRHAEGHGKPSHDLIADALFPIVLYVLLQSKIDNIFSCLGTLERFVHEYHRTRGQSGMCLSLLRAAASHIVHVDVAKFGIIIEENTKKRPSTSTSTTTASLEPALSHHNRHSHSKSSNVLSSSSSSRYNTHINQEEGDCDANKGSSNGVHGKNEPDKRLLGGGLGSGSASLGLGKSEEKDADAGKKKPLIKKKLSITKEDVDSLVQRQREVDKFKRVEKSLVSAGFL